jgi:apolipoprotein N-acyltransferase
MITLERINPLKLYLENVFDLKNTTFWQRCVFAFALGCIGVLGLTPFFIFPALLLSLWGAFWLLDQEIERHSSLIRTTWLGWCFGLGYFTAGVYWISSSLVVNLESLWWALPGTFFGFPGYLACFTAVSFGLTALWPFRGLSRGLAFGAFWIAGEWLRAHVFTGFPWNLIGYGWAFSPEIAQVASTTGIYGLSLLTIMLALALGYLTRSSPFERKVALGICFVVGLCWFWGKYRLNHQDVLPLPPFAVRLVQPNIPPSSIKSLEQGEAEFQELLKMTTPPSSLPLKAIIWPESAVSFFLELDSYSRDLMAKALPKGALLFTGAFRRTELDKTPFKIWNSLFVVNDQGNVVTHYDKIHLVPWAEYLPLRDFVDALFGERALKTLTMSHDVTPGPVGQSFSLPEEFPACKGLICYEAIFPRGVVNPTQKRPEWMINISNDAWYGNTTGPYQHLESARFRAIEEGIPLVRVANTGISAVFDAYGQLLGTLDLNEKGILDVFVPPPTSHIPLYGKWGDWITLLLISGSLAFAVLLSLKERLTCAE